MGYRTMGSPQEVGNFDIKRVARWLNAPEISELQRQARLATFSGMATISRTAWKQANLVKLNDVRHHVQGSNTYPL